MMQYREDKYGTRLSVLGYGCMRFSRKGGIIDLDKAEKEVMAAIDSGVNYFDTAYIYPGSEAALGKILTKNQCRDQVYIATKLPHYLMRSVEAAEKCFQEQLRRLQTDHIDYYLMHMLTDVHIWKQLCQMGIDKWLREKLETGQIRQVGFSYHGSSDAFCELIDAYDWDFCQIQYNYLDEHSQAGRTGLNYAASKGLPVVIMEPLRGGKLVSGLSREVKKLFSDTNKTPARWAFSWLWDQKEVTVVLSGMNSLDMVRENIETATQTLPDSFAEEEHAFIARVKQEIFRTMKVPCTGCRYCMPCPFGVDIPGIFHSCNVKAAEGTFWGLKQYIMCTVLRKENSNASLCRKCGKCETHCPQGIPIREKLQEAANEMEGIPFRFVNWVTRTFRLWK